MVRRRSTSELVARKPTAEGFASLPRAPLAVVCSDVRGLANVGLVFRLCDNLRARHLYLCGITGHPAYAGDPRPETIARRCDREIRRTAVMAVPWVPWSWHARACDVVEERRRAGDRIVVLEQAEGSVPLAHADLAPPLCLVVGHERRGVEAGVLELADVVAELPVLGMANSINVAMSLAVAGFEAARRSSAFGLGPL